MIIEPKKISCEAAFDMMFDYIDGTLEKSDALALEYHIESCENCRHELAERKEMLALVKSAAYEAPGELRQSVMDKIENIPQETNGGIIRRRVMKWAGTAVAACIALTVLIAYRGILFDGVKFDAANDNAEAMRIAKYDGAGAEIQDNSNPGAMYYAKHYTADEKVADGVYIETTISALDALAPGKYEIEASPEACVTLAKDAAEDDAMISVFDKIQAHEFPVIVVGKGVVDGSYLSSEPETLIFDGQVFLRYVITSEAEPILDAIINDLESKNAVYEISSPKTLTASNTVELLVLADSEN